MCFSIEKATGKAPLFIGKPQPEMLWAAMNKLGYTKEESTLITKNGYNVKFKILELISETVAFSSKNS